MAAMTDENSLVAARKRAEEAVEGMPDGELKVEAFKIILNRLLIGPGAAPAVPDTKTRRRSRQSAKRESAATTTEQEGVVPRSAPTRILALKADGFFEEQRGIAEVRDELQTHGWRYHITALSGTLMGLVQRRELRRLKVQDGNKTTYKYFNP
jgi:hypothetical protein